MKIEVDRGDLQKIEQSLNETPAATERALETLAKDIRFRWGVWVEATDAVDTRNYKHSIADHRIDAKQILLDTRLDSSVIYSDIIERGRRGEYPGKFPARSALEEIDRGDVVETRMTEEFDRILEK